MGNKLSSILAGHQLVPSQLIRRRSWTAAIIVGIVFLLILGKLFSLQYINAQHLQDQARNQSTVRETILATRGTIKDRTGQVLATTENLRSLTFQPVVVRKQLEELHTKDPSFPNTQDYLTNMAQAISNRIPAVTPDTLLAKMNSTELFVYLVRRVPPEIARDLQKQYPQIGSEYTPVRVYPAQSLAGNIIGITRTDQVGLTGLEQIQDARLAGINGKKTYDRGEDGTIIPGSEREQVQEKNGDSIQLTIDGDLQNYVQHKLDQTIQITGARSARAVVLDATNGQILTMANNDTFNPAAGTEGLIGHPLNPSIQLPFEPGSVNKIITAAGLMEYNLAKPTEVLHVPGQITAGGITVHDAWSHGVMSYTVTGVFGKSSNVGTLMLAQRIGPQRYYDLARKFGIGQRTGVELGGESAGYIPPMPQWSGATFSNLPIGQGLSMTLLQMASIYQTVANNGVRIPPRIIKNFLSESTETVEEPPEPESVRVISPESAEKLRVMFQAVTQDDPTGVQRGTGASAGIEGYQIAGKTGTAQQVDSNGRYSNSMYNITFAGIAPADKPRFVIAIMLDNPHRSTDGKPGASAAPLFKDIAKWILNKYQVPFSKNPPPHLILQK